MSNKYNEANTKTNAIWDQGKGAKILHNYPNYLQISDQYFHHVYKILFLVEGDQETKVVQCFYHKRVLVILCYWDQSEILPLTENNDNLRYVFLYQNHKEAKLLQKDVH